MLYVWQSCRLLHQQLVRVCASARLLRHFKCHVMAAVATAITPSPIVKAWNELRLRRCADHVPRVAHAVNRLRAHANFRFLFPTTLCAPVNSYCLPLTAYAACALPV